MRFSYIDIHSHTNFAAFDADREATIKRALDAGVAMINVGTQKDTSRKAVEIAEKSPPSPCKAKGSVSPRPTSHGRSPDGRALQKGESDGDGIYAIVGVHPIHTSKSFHDVQELGEGGKEFVSRGESFDISYYRELAKHPKVVGIGECGLDYFRFKIKDLSCQEELKKQKEAFRKQIELAIEVKKPLMLHIRNGSGRSAYKEAFTILKSYLINHKSGSSLRGNLHFFAGSIEEAKPFLDAGFSFSFTGVVTFATEYEVILRYLPLDRIMSETDSPYVAPVPYRGKRNEPLYVKEVVKTIARIRGEDEERVRTQILKNAEQLFSVSLA